MDIRSLTFGALRMGGRSLLGRENQFFGGKHHAHVQKKYYSVYDYIKNKVPYINF